MTTRNHSRAGPPIRNRLASILLHVPRYQFNGAGRLAADAGLSKHAVWRLLRGTGHPDYAIVLKVAEAIGRQVGRPIDLREIAVEAGSEYPTRYVCSIFGCKCLPPWAFRPDGETVAEFAGVRPGEWSTDARELPRN